MDEHDKKALEYRLKAEELRSMIPDMKDPNTCEVLEKIAAGYDHLALVQERLGNAEKIGGKF